MASDIGSTVRGALGGVVRDALKNAGEVKPQRRAGPLSGAKGVAAGAALAAAAPLARKGVAAMRANGANAAGKAASKAGDNVGSGLKDVVSRKIDDAGGASGLVKDAAGGLLSGGGDGGGGSGMPGVGKGRRMPVQQALTVGVPVETAYNQWTQFEDWPQFMQRVTRASQKDETTVSFAVKIWGKTKEFEAQIVTMRPDERIQWKVTQGISHSGVVTFHELGPRLTRIELDIDVDPGSLVEKAARGMRHVKRAVRADMARYKAFIEMQEHETGAWRGVIEDGELVEDHDDGYDEGREYSEVDDIYEDAPTDEERDDGDDEQEDDGKERRQSNGRTKARPPARSRGASSGDGRARASSGRAKPSGRRPAPSRS